jgi:hypothetical protein
MFGTRFAELLVNATYRPSAELDRAPVLLGARVREADALRRAGLQVANEDVFRGVRVRRRDEVRREARERDVPAVGGDRGVRLASFPTPPPMATLTSAVVPSWRSRTDVHHRVRVGVDEVRRLLTKAT